jgi:saccharopine dehydrogenase-like NADP-dependent oxidoreductase
MINQFDNVKEVMMRVGALPRFTNNEMSYYLSWSTNGLIKEYCNEADAIYEGKSIKVMPLEGAEKLTIEGESYEAFNTSGGCATMCETYEDKVENLSYKTIRYPGHLNHMKFLFNDLHLKKNKDILEKLFDKEVPRTTNDVIVFYVKVIGEIDGILQEKTYLKKIYGDDKFSAIQRTTASGVCSVLDMYLNGKIKSKGFIKQESILWDDFIDNKFGKVYT